MEVGNDQPTGGAPDKPVPGAGGDPSLARQPANVAWIPSLGLLGVVLLSLMFILYLMQNAWGTWNWVTGAAGVVSLATYVVLDRATWLAMMRSRRMQVGANVAVVTVLAVLLWGFVNHLNQRHYKRWDLTATGRFTLSQRSRDILKSLDKDVKITSLVSPDPREPLINAINDFLEEYKAVSPRISLEILDPHRNPEKAKEIAARLKIAYDDLFSVFFECGERTKRVGVHDIIERTPSSPYHPAPGGSKFKGEEAFTSAILNVIEEKQTTLYFTTGHEEPATDEFRRGGFGELGRFLQRENFKVEKLATATAKDIPKDCDLLVIVRPRKAFAPDETDLVRRYLDGGGKLLAMLDVTLDPESTAGLVSFFREYGIEIGDDLVIETSRRNFHPLFGNTYVVADDFGFHPIVEPMKNVLVLFPQTRSVGVAEDRRGYDVTSLIDTTTHSWAETDIRGYFEFIRGTSEVDPTFDEGTDKKGPVSIAAASAKAARDTGGDSPQAGFRIVVTGDADFASNDFLSEVSNTDFLLNSINWLTSREKLISIGAKSIDTPQIRMLTADENSLIRWITLAALPGFWLVVAGFVYIKRRR